MVRVLGEDGAGMRAYEFAKEAASVAPIFLVSSVLLTGLSNRAKSANALRKALPEFAVRFAPVALTFVALAPVEYAIRGPLRDMMPTVAFFAEPAPSSDRTNVGQRLAPWAGAGSETDGQTTARGGGNGLAGVSGVEGSGDPYAMEQPSAAPSADGGRAGEPDPADGGSEGAEVLDAHFAISSVGDADYCPPTRASRTVSGTLAAVGLLQVGMTPLQLAAAGAAAVAISLFMPTYEDMLAARARAEMAKERRRTGLE
ncbi:hypothetical protein FNF29_06139 [Cafeteria roenbergensis]|uniref:Uncharacterized protein n=1 Tax=Cafeteria roenbergensis TaxID=33653 RepID=A0A5A8C813_CAFRO|nr:hypothetical protein FNF29_06139 [Cafeteria roenbergensis]|eukprot:KAA0149252.1 hypothetical protein FNF29_06139 [Cafeteria roenbergensis]